jgi:hypothetical protein
MITFYPYCCHWFTYIVCSGQLPRVIGLWGLAGPPWGEVGCILPRSHAQHQGITLLLAGYNTVLLTTPL